MITLFIPCLIITVLTYNQILVTKNKLDLKILKLIFFLQKVLIFTNLFKVRLFTNIHKLYSIIIIFSALLLNEKHNILFILSLLFVSTFTENYPNDCLLNISNKYIEYAGIIICLYKLYKI